jgi:hypothetical protein
MDEFKKLLLRTLPPDVHSFLKREQSKAKKAGGRKVSLERIIYRIIREKSGSLAAPAAESSKSEPSKSESSKSEPTKSESSKSESGSDTISKSEAE